MNVYNAHNGGVIELFNRPEVQDSVLIANHGGRHWDLRVNDGDYGNADDLVANGHESLSQRLCPVGG